MKAGIVSKGLALLCMVSITIWPVACDGFGQTRESMEESENPASIEEATQVNNEVEKVADTAVLSEEVFPFYLYDGEKTSMDLNGDDTKDTISVTFGPNTTHEDATTPFITINDTTFDNEVIGNFFSLETALIVIDDVDKNDNYLEIAVIDYGPSDDPTTNFYRYDGQSLISIGFVPDDVYGPYTVAEVPGDGTIQCPVRLQILQTWYGRALFSLDSEGQLSEVVPMYYETFGSGMKVTQIKCIKLYSSPSLDAEWTWVEPSDREVSFPLTDNQNWVKVSYEDKEEGWLYLDPYIEDQEGEECDSSEVFTGLSFYD